MSATTALKRLPREESIELNREELEARLERLSAPPRLLTLGTHNACNARCLFCPPNSFPRFDLGIYKDFFEGRMGHFIRQAEKVTFTGYGEVLLTPDAGELLDYLNRTIPETWKIFTTNGSPLKPELIEKLLASKYVMQVSLHASRPELHERMTGLKGEFDRIVGAVREICRLRRERELGECLHVVIVDVVTRKNIGDLPDLLRLAWELGVPELRCNYVTAYEPAHLELSCFFDQEAANRAIEEAEQVLRGIEAEADPERFKHFEVRLPRKFGQPRKEEESRRICPDPWEHIYVECQGPVLPCCMWGEHIGNLKEGGEVDSLFNGEIYRELRSGLAGGEPHPWCAACVNYRGYNVDNPLCHLTNRPETQKRLLAEARSGGLL